MPAVSIHPATAEERLAAYRNVHETWGRGLPLDEFLARRLKSVGHNRARWWVAETDLFPIAGGGRASRSSLGDVRARLRDTAAPACAR